MGEIYPMSAGNKCSCQLCNPTYVDVPVPVIKDQDNDTEWSVVTSKTNAIRFQGKTVAAKAPTIADPVSS